MKVDLNTLDWEDMEDLPSFEPFEPRRKMADEHTSHKPRRTWKKIQREKEREYDGE